MKRHLFAAVALTTFGWGPATDAAVTFQMINKGAPSNVSTTVSGYQGYIIRFVSDSGNIGGVDLQSGTNGIFGPMVQRWSDPDGDAGNYTVKTITGAGVNAPGSTTTNNFDSHLLVPPGGFIGQIGLDESVGTGTFPAAGSGIGHGFPNNSLSAGYSVGSATSILKGAWGIDGAAQSTTVDVAYVVLGPEAFFDLGDALVVAGGVTYYVDLYIPEPTTLAMVGAAALGIVARRRRS